MQTILYRCLDSGLCIDTPPAKVIPEDEEESSMGDGLGVSTVLSINS